MPQDQARQYDYIGTKGVIGFYFQALEQITGVSWTSLLANTFTSSQDTETYAGLGNVVSDALQQLKNHLRSCFGQRKPHRQINGSPSEPHLNNQGTI